jgi:hypothetical protein
MVKRTFLYFTVFSILWLAFTEVKIWPSKSISQWEDNDRLIDDYLFENNKCKTLIVGSSMAYRMSIKQNSYKDSVFNLSLGGLGIYDGLEVIKQSGRIPKLILIESNVIYREERNNYAASFFMPGLYYLKENFKGLRQEYRPITFAQYLYYGISNILRRFTIDKGKTLIPNNVKVPINNAASQVKCKNLEKLLQNYSNVLHTTDWTKIEKKLSRYISYFSQKGSEIVFFEMPTEKKLLQSELNTHIQNLVQTNWPSFTFIHAGHMYTTDGLHLSPDVAKQYLPILLEKVTK